MTRQEIRDYIKFRLLDLTNATIQDGLINVMIDASNSELAGHTRVILDRGTIATVALQEKYLLTSVTPAMLRIDRLYYSGSQLGELLSPYANAAENDQTGTPDKWKALGLHQFIINPIPNSIYTLSVFGMKAPAALSSDTSSPEFPLPFHTDIAEIALAKLLAMYEPIRGERQKQFAEVILQKATSKGWKMMSGSILIPQVQPSADQGITTQTLGATVTLRPDL